MFIKLNFTYTHDNPAKPEHKQKSCFLQKQDGPLKTLIKPK